LTSSSSAQHAVAFDAAGPPQHPLGFAPGAGISVVDVWVSIDRFVFVMSRETAAPREGREKSNRTGGRLGWPALRSIVGLPGPGPGSCPGSARHEYRSLRHGYAVFE
jgi:hypothetical protein